MDAPYPPEWLMERNAIHLPVVGQPIVAAYNLGPDTPPNNQTLVRGSSVYCCHCKLILRFGLLWSGVERTCIGGHLVGQHRILE